LKVVRVTLEKAADAKLRAHPWAGVSRDQEKAFK
jgi:hypothetical protein